MQQLHETVHAHASAKACKQIQHQTCCFHAKCSVIYACTRKPHAAHDFLHAASGESQGRMQHAMLESRHARRACSTVRRPLPCTHVARNRIARQLQKVQRHIALQHCMPCWNHSHAARGYNSFLGSPTRRVPRIPILSWNPCMEASRDNRTKRNITSQFNSKQFPSWKLRSLLGIQQTCMNAAQKPLHESLARQSHQAQRRSAHAGAQTKGCSGFHSFGIHRQYMLARMQ